VKLRVTARVQVMVEVGAVGAWSSDVTLDQIHKQAAEEAKRAISAIMTSDSFRIVGTPNVITVTTEKPD
jgi:hypothetical protein